MIYIIGTVSQLNMIRSKINFKLYELLYDEVSALDLCYGNNRNIYDNDGGYCMAVDSADDVSELSLDSKVFETIEQFDRYIKLTYINNNEFVISIYIPYDFTPPYILRQL